MTLALKARGVDLEPFPPVVMSMIMGSLARMVLHERGLGITRGHDQATAFIEQLPRPLRNARLGPAAAATRQLSEPGRASDSEVTSNTIT